MRRWGYFIIKPKSELLQLIANYDKGGWGDTTVWKIPESSDIQSNKELYFVNYVKVAFLARIIRIYETKAVRRIHPHYEKIVHRIFGSPPKFTIAVLDQWWSFKRAEAMIDFNHVVNSASPDILLQIEETNDERINEWLSIKIAFYENHIDKDEEK